MLLRWSMAFLHLLALGIGLGAVWARFLALRTTLDPERLRRVFRADNLWGLAGGLWIATGLVRLLMGLEKSTEFYLSQPLFQWKLGLVALILLLEIAPMIGLIRWRNRMRKSQGVDTSRASAYARISLLQALLTVIIVALATGMARGLTL